MRMKQLNFILAAAIGICCFQTTQAQLCTGDKGPNLLAEKGSFSTRYITTNDASDPCTRAGTSSFNPTGNIGNALVGCSAAVGASIPCSDYNYTASSNGMMPEFTYSLVKVMGDASGSNCLHTPIWQGKDHSNDGGYFMAVNGAPSVGYSTLFYQIKSIPVCIGTTYEFSAWVLNMMPPGGSTNAAPNVSFVVNGQVIGTSGAIAYDRAWHQVGGSFTATTDHVDLQVINATQVAGGNDLGLDDISFRVCKSRIIVDGPETYLEGDSPNPQFTVTDPLDENTWYKWQLSTDGGITFANITNGSTTTYNANHKFVVSPNFIGQAVTEMNGFIYRLVVSTSKSGLNNPDCIYFNDYKLIVTSGGPLPIQLSSFNGTYTDGVSSLNWATSQEINSDHFELLRSFNGNDYEVAANVRAAGNNGKAYQFKDKVTVPGNVVYYKLKQVDKDGQFSFSNIIKLNVSKGKTSLQLFPNPVINDFTATLTVDKSASATLLIRNVTGQTVYTKTVNLIKGNNSLVVTDASLKTGMYYVSIINDEINYSSKLQKQ